MTLSRASHEETGARRLISVVAGLMGRAWGRGRQEPGCIPDDREEKGEVRELTEE